jgi:hypothetical protein
MPIFENQKIIDPALFIDNKLVFMNLQTERIKLIKVGFSFPGFFLTFITLFTKGLTKYGIIIAILSLIGFGLINTGYNEHLKHYDRASNAWVEYMKNMYDTEYKEFYKEQAEKLQSHARVMGKIYYIILSLALPLLLAMSILTGIKANLWQARDLLAKGWIFQNAKAAKKALKARKWDLGQN